MLFDKSSIPILPNTLISWAAQHSGEALIIDPERDIDRHRELAAENGLRITATAETHIHADFVSGGREFAQDLAIATEIFGKVHHCLSSVAL